MSQFDYFIVLAEMRTGSNFLEANLNSFDGLYCHGEAFNPHFIGYPKRENLLGITEAERNADPAGLITAIKDAEGLNGFRFFNNHDPRALNLALMDTRCAKIILTRNPVESFVSWKIAAATGQWKLTNVKHVRNQTVRFDPEEFEAHMQKLQDFRQRVLKSLQRSGQTAFYVDYEDLHDVAVMNGIAAFLGVDARIEQLDRQLKKQNPLPLLDKVSNPEEMTAALAALDRFDLKRTPNFEPRRGPAVPTYVAAAAVPLLFMPLKSGPVDAVERWMASLDQCSPDDLQRNFKQNSLRDWLSAHPGHRCFTVLRHPVARAHAAFCTHILSNEPKSFGQIRDTLRKMHGVEIPKEGISLISDTSYGSDTHHNAFLAFLGFVRRNLSAQTAIRVDPAWASQLSLVQGLSSFVPPDVILREDELDTRLQELALAVGVDAQQAISQPTDPHAGRLSDIYDEKIEKAARAAYGRDYEAFGFDDYAA